MESKDACSNDPVRHLLVLPRCVHESARKCLYQRKAHSLSLRHKGIAMYSMYLKPDLAFLESGLSAYPHVCLARLWAQLRNFDSVRNALSNSLSEILDRPKSTLDLNTFGPIRIILLPSLDRILLAKLRALVLSHAHCNCNAWSEAIIDAPCGVQQDKSKHVGNNICVCLRHKM